MVALREALNADEEFVVFKTIVGYKSVFPHQWEEERRDFKRDEATRNQRQDELADSITEENWPIWKARLVTVGPRKVERPRNISPLRAVLVRHRCSTAQGSRSNCWLIRSILPDWTIQPIARKPFLTASYEGRWKTCLGSALMTAAASPRSQELATSPADTLVALVSKVASQAVNGGDEERLHQLGCGGYQALRRQSAVLARCHFLPVSHGPAKGGRSQLDC